MVPEQSHILVVDDDDRLRDLLCRFLSENGFRATTAASADEARNHLKALRFDFLVLDLMMPGESGLEFATWLRQRDTVPILMLTAMSETDDRVAGLECGADDYLVKPFDPRELLLRIHAILRRAPQPREVVPELRFGDVVFNLPRGELRRQGRLLHLTASEISLLNALCQRPGAVLTREQLSDMSGTSGGSRAIDVQMTRLRRKIEADPKFPRYLRTVRGRGYSLTPE